MKGYRTIAFNVLMLIAAVTGAAWTPELINEWIEAIAVIWAAGNAVLRAVTNTPMFKKE